MGNPEPSRPRRVAIGRPPIPTNGVGTMNWRTDFPPTDREFLLAWHFGGDDSSMRYEICEMSHVETVGTEDNPVELYLPICADDGMELEFDGDTWFAWADLVPPVDPVQWPVHSEVGE